MGLANIMNVPLDERTLMAWSFENSDQHFRIIGAIQKQKNKTLNTYVLDPIPLYDLQSWLRRHQTVHNDMNTTLGLNGIDLTDVDWQKPDQREAWIRLHANEHILAMNKLGIG